MNESIICGIAVILTIASYINLEMWTKRNRDTPAPVAMLLHFVVLPITALFFSLSYLVIKYLLVLFIKYIL